MLTRGRKEAVGVPREKWLVTVEVIREPNEATPLEWNWEELVGPEAKAVMQRFVENVADDDA